MTTGSSRNTTGTSMKTSRRPPASIRSRLCCSRTSAAWARSTSPRGVPRSTATTSPSTNRTTAGTGTRTARPSIAVVNGSPARRSASTSASSRLSSPRDRRTVRSSAARGPSPAVTARQSRSARVGSSRSIRACRRATCRPSHPSRPSTPPRTPSTAPPATATAETGRPTTMGSAQAARTAMRNPPNPHSTCSARNRPTSPATPASRSRRATAADPPSHRSTSRAPSCSKGLSSRSSPGSGVSGDSTPSRSRVVAGSSPRRYGSSRAASRGLRTRGAPDTTSPMPTTNPRLTSTASGSITAPVPWPEHPPTPPSRPSSQDPLLVGEPADSQHHAVAGDRHARSDGQDHGAAGAAVGGDRLGLGCQQQQDGPRGREGHPRRDHHPGLASLQLLADPLLVAEEARQGAQHATQLAAANLPGQPQGLDHPVGGRVGQLVLEPVQRGAEPPGGMVIVGEAGERRPQRPGPPLGQARDRLGQRQPGAHTRGQVVDGLRPDLPQLPEASPPPRLQRPQRQPRGQPGKGQAEPR